MAKWPTFCIGYFHLQCLNDDYCIVTKTLWMFLLLFCPQNTLFLLNIVLAKLAHLGVAGTISMIFNSITPRGCGSHYCDVIMRALAAKITGVSIVYSIVCAEAGQRKRQRSAWLGFVKGNSPVTGEFSAQKASNAENVSIRWRHPSNFKRAHVTDLTTSILVTFL